VEDIVKQRKTVKVKWQGKQVVPKMPEWRIRGIETEIVSPPSQYLWEKKNSLTFTLEPVRGSSNLSQEDLHRLLIKQFGGDFIRWIDYTFRVDLELSRKSALKVAIDATLEFFERLGLDASKFTPESSEQIEFLKADWPICWMNSAAIELRKALARRRRRTEAA
jgi:hypothetical protein